jgi:hypothetical protein
MAYHVSFQGYLSAAALALARKHRPVWSTSQRRMTCRCGTDLPCRVRQVFTSRDDWPSHRQLSQVIGLHRRGDDGFCTDCRMVFGLVQYPCTEVRLAVRTFAAELADRILEDLR